MHHFVKHESFKTWITGQLEEICEQSLHHPMLVSSDQDLDQCPGCGQMMIDILTVISLCMREFNTAEGITGRHTNHPLDYTPGIERLIHNNCYNKSSCRTLIQSRWCLFTVMLPVWGLGWGEFWMFSHWPMMGAGGDQAGCPLPPQCRCDNLCTSGRRLEA